MKSANYKHLLIKSFFKISRGKNSDLSQIQGYLQKINRINEIMMHNFKVIHKLNAHHLFAAREDEYATHWYDFINDEVMAFVALCLGLYAASWALKGVLVLGAMIFALPLTTISYAVSPYIIWRVARGIALSISEQKYYIPPIPEYDKLISLKGYSNKSLGTKVTDAYRGKILKDWFHMKDRSTPKPKELDGKGNH